MTIMHSDTMTSYIYLLQDGNDRNTDIYKIGRTSPVGADTRVLRRLKDYSQGTIVYNIFHVPNKQVFVIEACIIALFKSKYTLIRGNEWFRGNVYDMKKDIDSIIDDHHNKLNNEGEFDSDTDDDSFMDINDIQYANPNPTMNIKQAIDILTKSSNDNHKYFIDQLNHFKIQQTSPLKDYLDFINKDVLEWFRTSPESIKAQSTFYKFKAPINTLLEHKDVIETYGHTFCTTLARQITQVFSQNRECIIKERNNNIYIDNKNNNDTNSETDSNEASSMVPNDIRNKNENITTEPLHNYELQEQNNKLQVQYEILQAKHSIQDKYYETILNNQHKYQDTIIKYYETTFQHITKNNENLTKNNEHLMKLLEHYASK
jgi:T5orf172 domain